MDCSMALMILILISARARNMKAGSALQYTRIYSVQVTRSHSGSRFFSDDICWRRAAIKICVARHASSPDGTCVGGQISSLSAALLE